MIAADGNSDGQVNNYDKNDMWIIQSTSKGYSTSDFNLDGSVDLTDKFYYWVSNTGKSCQLPN